MTANFAGLTTDTDIDANLAALAAHHTALVADLDRLTAGFSGVALAGILAGPRARRIARRIAAAHDRIAHLRRIATA